MQYLAFDRISKVQAIGDKILYSDSSNQLHIGKLDEVGKLQINRTLFEKQVTKSLLIPKFDSITVLLEEPDMAYLDETRNAFNQVALVNRSTMAQKALFKLNFSEIPNCVYFSEQEPLNDCIIVGTVYLKLRESVPTKGRLLIFDAASFKLLQEFDVDGSAQSVIFDGSWLTVAVNNQVQIHSIVKNTLSRDRPFTMELHDQKQTGTFIHSLTPLGSNAIVVADMAGCGICTYDVQKTRLNRAKLVEAASSHLSLWTNQVVAISEN